MANPIEILPFGRTLEEQERIERLARRRDRAIKLALVELMAIFGAALAACWHGLFTGG